MSTTILVLAKTPVPGQVKTRLCPPATPGEAARIAAASLLDTLDTTRGWCTVVALTGSLADAQWRIEVREALARCRVVPQRGSTFAARLIAAHTDAGGNGPVIQIGMDTPQLDRELLDEAGRALESCEAVLGPARDGGWWALGVHDPRHARVLAEVPMSTPDTGALTLRALRALGLRVTLLPELSDVDTMEDAKRVAIQVPNSRFATAVAQVHPEARR
ncbi:MAG: glycosyltransferase [Actinomycetota bacterium]|nr:glycosyltransferase [Actinomycetota bacterium]